MWPFDEMFTPKKPNPIEEVSEKDTCGLVCITCGQTPKELVNLNGLYFCEEDAKAEQRRVQWESEEHLWKEDKK